MLSKSPLKILKNLCKNPKSTQLSINLNILYINSLKIINYIKNINFKCSYFLLLIILVCNCSSEKKYDKSKAKSLISSTNDYQPNDNLKNVIIEIPKPKKNQSWFGSSSLVNQSIENIDKKFSLESTGWFRKKDEIQIKRTWYKNIFYFEDFAKSFVYSPIIYDGKIYVLDSSGDLTSFNLSTKQTLWHKRIFNKLWLKNYKVAHLGACNDKLFAVAGVNQIKAINQINGNIIWEKDLSVIFNSTPICDGESVYILSSDNKTFALNASNGEIKWIHYGIPKALAIFGSSQIVIEGDYLIASYSSGEIYSLNKKTGQALWSNDLNSNQNYNSNFFLNDIDATPLIKNGVVYAIGNGGYMKAMSIDNGDEIWKMPISSVVDFWLAGDFLYVINNDNKLFAVHKKTGMIKWLVQLENYKNPKKVASKHNYIAVIMVGNKLLIARQDGDIFIASPFDGKIEKRYSLNKRVLHAPVIIDNKIYFYGMSRFKTKLIEIE